MSDYMEMEADILEERYGLALQRIKEIPGEHLGQDSLEDYFSFCAGFVLMIDDTRGFLAGGGLESAPLEELERRNQALYGDILPSHYEKSFCYCYGTRRIKFPCCYRRFGLGHSCYCICRKRFPDFLLCGR